MRKHLPLLGQILQVLHNLIKTLKHNPFRIYGHMVSITYKSIIKDFNIHEKLNNTVII